MGSVIAKSFVLHYHHLKDKLKLESKYAPKTSYEYDDICSLALAFSLIQTVHTMPLVSMSNPNHNLSRFHTDQVTRELLGCTDREQG